jgi:hypothetical protein
MKISETKLFLLGISLMIAALSACTGNRKPVERLPWVPTDLASAAEILNKKCPKMVDPETRLDSVLLLQEGLYFYYSLPNKDKSVIATGAFTAYLLPVIIDNIRMNPRMEMFRDSSVVMLFNYRDRNGEMITEFPVGPNHYR